MSTHQIHVFISHAWAYSGHYDTLSGWIFDQNWSVGQASLDFRDYSVPKSDPIHNITSDFLLRQAIFDKISRSHVIVFVTGMYSMHSRWIKEELNGAKHYQKPILAVNPWAQERKSSIVAKAANAVCGWNSQTIVNSIWKLHRGE
jgi:hypothetical protein